MCAQGMLYLHNTAQQIHGYLSSNVCYIDARWILKISGYDFNVLQKVDIDSDCSQLLWTAPEVLRARGNPERTKSGDVYSFGIILQEILYRAEPYFLGSCSYSSAGKYQEAS